MKPEEPFVRLSRETFDHKNRERFIYKAPEGLSEKLVRFISKEKHEPAWMLKKRLDSFRIFKEKSLPSWGPSLAKLDLARITYYLKPDAKHNSQDWNELPPDIKRTFERLGIPEAERRVLGGTGAQYESQVVYHKLKREWEEKGVIFEDMDVALHKYPELVKEYFMTCCIPITYHKFIALHAAVWSGGTFIYVPKGVKVKTPLQAYFRMNARKGGQFEHTLIIADEGAELQYIEGCSAPRYVENSLHAGCVEIFVKKHARVRYSSVENWSRNTYNLNTKKANVEEGGIIEWIGGNLGSGVTMLYPASMLLGRGSQAHHIAIAFGGPGQHQDTGAKVIHLASDTSSTIISKSISKDGGITVYRGLLKISKGAKNCTSNVRCDALLIGPYSKTDTIPYIDVQEKDATISHEATVGKISQEQLFYLMSRGLSQQQAMEMIVSGFIEPIVKELPLEYAVELNKLIEMEMENRVG
ncbi:MAG: Fe-S cluster assembly protein SufB [Nanoarchaeota archaeon]